jgi:hypothetical protein
MNAIKLLLLAFLVSFSLTLGYLAAKIWIVLFLLWMQGPPQAARMLL